MSKLVWSWPAALCLVTAGITAGVLKIAWSYRDRRAARLWIGTVAAIGIWVLSYGLGLLIFDPSLRQLFEIPLWLGATASIPLLLAFALEYTGRGDLVRSPWMYALGIVWVGIGLLYATNPHHHLMWTDYRLSPVFGAATVAFSPRIGLQVAHALAYLTLTLASILLLDAIVNYGSVFRKQAVAVLVGVSLPSIANIVWLFNLGPVPQFNLTPVAFSLTAVAGMYAFFVEEMFDLSPAVRRFGEQAAIDDLGSPVAVVDIEGRLLSLNGAGEQLFGITTDQALTTQLATLTDEDIELSPSRQLVTQSVGNRRRDFEVAISTVNDSTGQLIGYTIGFTDITDERHRRQQLEVVNRFLRHNLRNDMQVVRGRVEIIGEQANEVVDDDIDIVIDQIEDLQSISEKARKATAAFEDLIPSPVAVNELLGAVQQQFESDARITVDTEDMLTISTDEQILKLIVRNLVENAVEHGVSGSIDRNQADINNRVEIMLQGSATNDGVRIIVSDDGPGIPGHELSPLKDERETALEHGSGLGLWLVQWGVETLGGEMDIETDADGTKVAIRLPELENTTDNSWYTDTISQ
ncbi:histidine kinase N-terminal 7TM domain-containing protein [Halovenus rubra]|uniref:histidine kinase n=2 Tax=Halovenus rubra TaxID=869890 RepID=A0ABD5X793_9EURY|nr:histidine kinase N-terminal 7TM domain-containing protein [Halovenus rubra]